MIIPHEQLKGFFLLASSWHLLKRHKFSGEYLAVSLNCSNRLRYTIVFPCSHFTQYEMEAN